LKPQTLRGGYDFFVSLGSYPPKADAGSSSFRNRKVKTFKIYCGVEQLVARWAHNPKVVGSSPTPATKGTLEEISGFFIFVPCIAFTSFTLKNMTDYTLEKQAI
jgi:hypothetical protein